MVQQIVDQIRDGWRRCVRSDSWEPGGGARGGFQAHAKCLVKLGRLEELGHELRRPEADYLRDDIHELRVRFQSVNYRMLYFFRGRTAAAGYDGTTSGVTYRGNWKAPQALADRFVDETASLLVVLLPLSCRMCSRPNNPV